MKTAKEADDLRERLGEITPQERDHRAWRLVRASRQELGVALVTCAATLTSRLEIAVLVGSALSLGLYLHRTSRPAMRTMGVNRNRDEDQRPFVVVSHAPDALPECPQLKLLRMEGSVYFGATVHVSDRLQALRDQPAAQQHLLVMAKSMNFVDMAVAELWCQELCARSVTSKAPGAVTLGAAMKRTCCMEAALPRISCEASSRAISLGIGGVNA